MRNNKKGTIEEGIFWIIRVIIIMVVVFILIFFINSALTKMLNTENLELDLIAARIINSPSCLAMQKTIEVYEEDVYNTVRVYPGIIELDKYNEKSLNKTCIIQEGAPAIGIKIKINGMNELYINKEYYEDTEPLTFSDKYYKLRKVLPIQVVDKNGKKETKTLEVIVVAKKK